MSKKAIMFGSIGSVAETSDVQRRAYNKALAEAGVPWEWDRETYADLLQQAGGRERLAQLSDATAAGLSPEKIASIHERKTQIACEEIVNGGVALRAGVTALIAAAKERGMKIGFVTTTYRPNIDAIFTAAGDALSKDDFATIVTRDDVERGKPAPDAYEKALAALGVSAAEAIAVEDTANSVMSAKRAGLTVVATPGEITKDQDFWQADVVVEALADAGGTLDRRVLALLN